ncbi:MAG: methyltransferase domain-containing protein [Desulfurococcales archaeon]|nr:methyltransferase domain-containing protein [Desulfurococcales archaeon]
MWGNLSDQIVSYYWVMSALQGQPWVPFVPSNPDIVREAFRHIRLGKDDVFYDLGCGDGRIAVLAASEFNVRRSVCVEKNPKLAEKALSTVKEERLDGKVIVINRDMFQIPISDATVVYMYLLTSVNEMLRSKLERELIQGTKVLTLDFKIPGWTPYRTLGTGKGWQKTIYIYVKGVSNIVTRQI